MHRSAKWAVAGVAALAIGATALEACSTKKPNGGLVVSIATDGKIPIDKLKVTIRQVDARGAGTVNEVVRSCQVTSDCPLPTTLGVISNGDPTASVVVTAIAYDKSGVVLDTRTHTVTSVPVDRTANLVIVLSASCAAQASADGTSKCAEGLTCDPATGGCTSATKSAAGLPEYVPGSEYDVGVPEVSTTDTGSTDTATDGGTDTGGDTGGWDTHGADTGGDIGCMDEALATTCSSGRCGTQTNNCKKTVTCPTTACTAPQSCGGGGTPNLCGGCDWTSTYPAAAGCPSGNHAWQCWTPPAIGNRTVDFNVLTLCGDNVIKDTKTGLMWAQNEEPAASWATAKAQCTASRRGGFADWRLPTAIELQSIVDYLKATTPSIDSKFQGKTVGSTPTGGPMWSSSSADALSSGNAWSVGFGLGAVGPNATSLALGVRCVR